MADVWIPVEDCLPEEGASVLVAFVSRNTALTGELEVCEAAWWTHADGQQWEGFSFTGYSGDVETPRYGFRCEVLYWQALPTPPPYEASRASSLS